MAKLTFKVNRGYEEADAIDVAPEVAELRKANVDLQKQSGLTAGLAVAFGIGVVALIFALILVLSKG